MFVFVCSGKHLGVLAAVFYIIEGAVFEAPFFAGGTSGFKTFLGGSGGYILSYVLAAWVVVSSS